MSKGKLDVFLRNVSESEFYQLKHRIAIAENLRYLEKTYKVLQTRMASKLGLSLSVYKQWRKGAIDFNMRMLAKIECLSTDLFSEDNNLVKVSINEKK
jgi:hypothetical protein